MASSGLTQQELLYTSGLIKQMYCKFLETCTTANPIPINQGGANVVYRINEKLVGKTQLLGQRENFKTTREFSMLKSKRYVWDHLHNSIDTENDHIKRNLRLMVALPLYREIDVSPTGNVYLVSIEPFINGIEFGDALMDSAFAIPKNILSVMYILFDVLNVLGKYRFNHNDLHSRNLMICSTGEHSFQYASMTEPGVVIHTRYYPVLIDFDWSTVASVPVEQGLQDFFGSILVGSPNSVFAQSHIKCGTTLGTWSGCIDVTAFLLSFYLSPIANKQENQLLKDFAYNVLKDNTNLDLMCRQTREYASTLLQ